LWKGSVKLKDKKPVINTIVAVLTVLCGLVAIISILVRLVLPLYILRKSSINIKDAGSIGIIGGADGPTVIFLAGGAFWSFVSIIFALAALAGIIWLIAAKRRKTNE